MLALRDWWRLYWPRGVLYVALPWLVWVAPTWIAIPAATYIFLKVDYWLLFIFIDAPDWQDPFMQRILRRPARYLAAPLAGLWLVGAALGVLGGATHREALAWAGVTLSFFATELGLGFIEAHRRDRLAPGASPTHEAGH